MLEAVGLLRDFGVRGLAALPYAHHLITLTKLAAERPGSLTPRSEALRKWFWRTTYSEHFTGQTGAQIRRDLELLTGTTDPAADPDIAKGAEVTSLGRLRKGTVRTRAFLLFLARRPKDAATADERCEIVGRNGDAAYLFRGHANDPGNAVIGDPSELRELLSRLDSPNLDAEITRVLGDKFALPPEAFRLLPDRGAFVAKRRELLLAEEATLIRELDLKPRLGEETYEDFGAASTEHEGPLWRVSGVTGTSPRS